MTDAPLHFAFCDGAYHFDCPSCDAKCCRGAGFAGSLEREVPRLFTLYPSLAHMAVGRQGPIVYFANPPNACYFLDPDRLCRIERDHGRALKPGVCGLFPFNFFLRLGETVVVRPHFLCPLLAVVPARPGDVEGTHARLSEQVRESALLAPAFFDAHVPQAPLHPSADAAATLAREIRFRDRSAEALGQGRLIDLLHHETSDRVAFDERVRRAAALLGLDAADLERPKDAVDDLLVLLAAPLRTTLWRLSSEGQLVALAVGALVYRGALALGGTASLAAGFEIQGKLGPALRLLGRLDEPLVVEGQRAPRIPALADPALALAASLALRAQRGAGALDALEMAILPATPTADRSVLLNALGGALERSPEG